jgi:hypothetical protein
LRICHISVELAGLDLFVRFIFIRTSANRRCCLASYKKNTQLATGILVVYLVYTLRQTEEKQNNLIRGQGAPALHYKKKKNGPVNKEIQTQKPYNLQLIHHIEIYMIIIMSGSSYGTKIYEEQDKNRSIVRANDELQHGKQLRLDTIEPARTGLRVSQLLARCKLSRLGLARLPLGPEKWAPPEPCANSVQLASQPWLCHFHVGSTVYSNGEACQRWSDVECKHNA